MVDVIVTTAGGIEEAFIKCLAPTYVGDFALPGKYLRSHGVNRIGNLLVPNDNYCKFEDWLMPILDKILEEQKSTVSFSAKCRLIFRAKSFHLRKLYQGLVRKLTILNRFITGLTR